MDLDPHTVRAALHDVDLHGWDGAAGRQLLECVRTSVVLPVVRRSGLRGPAADQAEASAWEAAWDALRRPTARTADNPGGMVWVAARRAVWAELDSARAPAVNTPTVTPAADERGAQRLHHVSLDYLMDAGWQPIEALPTADELSGPLVARLVSALVDAGWQRRDAIDAIAIMADHAAPRSAGHVGTRWRWVALKLGVPEWRARRLASLLLGDADSPGIMELVTEHGAGAFDDVMVRAALRSTTVRWSAGPGAWLAQYGPGLRRRVPA